jgi:ADP-ribose pyrophosphatase YjhB (NUDIX family)
LRHAACSPRGTNDFLVTRPLPSARGGSRVRSVDPQTANGHECKDGTVMAVSAQFCRVCGGSLSRMLVEAEARDRLVCEQGHILYENPNIVAGTIPVFNGRVWLLRRSIEPRSGYWTFPAGYMELGESVEEAAARETLEEIGIDVKLTGLLNVYSRPEAVAVFVVYLAEASGDAVAQAETLEVQAFWPEEIPWDDLAFWSTRKALEDWVNGLRVAESGA